MTKKQKEKKFKYNQIKMENGKRSIDRRIERYREIDFCK